MRRTGQSRLAGLVAVLVLCLSVVPVRAGFEMAYCSSQNTADGDFQAMNDDYQSNGWCTDHCNAKGTYAFAVVMYKSCWCSNYIPKDQGDSGDCNTNCPGYPSEKCGNQNENLYGYIKLKGDPSGTIGGSKPTSANVSPSPTSAPITSSTETSSSPEATTPSSAPPSIPLTVVVTPAPETVVQTVTESQEITTVTPSPTSKPTTLQTTTSDPPIVPQTSIVVSTVGGAIVTQTVLYTPTQSPFQQSPKSGSNNTGAIVGGVVGGVVGIAAIAGLLFFFLWRRRRNVEDPSSGVQRNTSTMSKSGLLRTEKLPQHPPPILTSFNRRQSRNLDQDSISPISGSDRRNSRHLVDQRLNPSTVFMYDNSSQLSVGSVDDSRDYHRPLNVRNPDPEP